MQNRHLGECATKTGVANWLSCAS